MCTVIVYNAKCVQKDALDWFINSKKIIKNKGQQTDYRQLEIYKDIKTRANALKTNSDKYNYIANSETTRLVNGKHNANVA